MVMEGKKNPYDPAELYRQWLENTSQDAGFHEEYESISDKFPKSIQSTKHDAKLSLMERFQDYYW